MYARLSVSNRRAPSARAITRAPVADRDAPVSAAGSSEERCPASVVDLLVIVIPAVALATNRVTPQPSYRVEAVGSTDNRAQPAVATAALRMISRAAGFRDQFCALMHIRIGPWPHFRGGWHSSGRAVGRQRRYFFSSFPAVLTGVSSNSEFQAVP